MNKKNFNADNRILFILILFFMLIILIIGKLFYVQIIKSNEYSKRALEQIYRNETVTSERGKIFDRNGKTLAMNVSAASVFVDPSGYKNDVEYQNKTIRESVAEKLSPLLKMDKQEILEMIQTDQKVKLKQWVDLDTAVLIRDLNLDGVIVEDGYKRYYPFGSIGSHVIGFTNVDNVGQYGIEASYNEKLSGIPGRSKKTVDALNRELPTGDTQDFKPDDGISIVSTIDQSIQEIANKEAEKIIQDFKAHEVSIVVQETETGDILAMTSNPSFDPNQPRTAINEAQKNKWKELKDEDITKMWYENWKNPVIGNVYEPGSTFKLITAAAALEENTTNPYAHYYCTGYIRDITGAKPIKCVSYKDPHGDITLSEALAKSCNPTFVYVNRELGRENFLKYVKAFGFGRKTGIKLNGEEIGIIPKSAEDISEIRLATMSYGHGIAVTPIQLVNAVSAIGNDGMLMTPRIVKEELNSGENNIQRTKIEEKRQVISPETSKKMLEMMKNVIENGSGSKAKSMMYNIGGKTGTAGKNSPDGGYDENKYVSSFVGLAPIEDPKITVLVVVDEPQEVYYGSLVAAPYAKNIIEKTLKYMGVPESTGNKNKGEEIIVVPNLKYKIIGDAGLTLNELGLKYTLDQQNITDQTIVLEQDPMPGTEIKQDSIIKLKVNLNDKAVFMLPDFTKKSVEEANAYLESSGLKFETEGEGKIIKQNPEPGASVKKGDIVTFKLGEITDDTGANKETKYVDGVIE